MGSRKARAWRIKLRRATGYSAWLGSTECTGQAITLVPKNTYIFVAGVYVKRNRWERAGLNAIPWYHPNVYYIWQQWTCIMFYNLSYLPLRSRRKYWLLFFSRYLFPIALSVMSLLLLVRKTCPWNILNCHFKDIFYLRIVCLQENSEATDQWLSREIFFFFVRAILLLLLFWQPQGTGISLHSEWPYLHNLTNVTCFLSEGSTRLQSARR